MLSLGQGICHCYTKLSWMAGSVGFPHTRAAGARNAMENTHRVDKQLYCGVEVRQDPSKSVGPE